MKHLRLIDFGSEQVSSYRLKKCSELIFTCNTFEYYVNNNRGYVTMVYIVDKGWDKSSKGRVMLERRIHFRYS